MPSPFGGGFFVCGSWPIVVGLLILGDNVVPKTKTFKAGQKVTLKSTAKTYETGENIPAKYKGKVYTVQQVDTKRKRVLLKELYS